MQNKGRGGHVGRTDEDMRIICRDDFAVHEALGFNSGCNKGGQNWSRAAFRIVPNPNRDAALSFVVEIFEELFIGDGIHRNGDRFLSERECFFKNKAEIIAFLVGIKNDRFFRGRKRRIKSRSNQNKIKSG